MIRSLVFKNFKVLKDATLDLGPFTLLVGPNGAGKANLAPNGAGFAGVLDQLRDKAPERFEALNAELASWLPEYDRVLFDTPNQGLRAFLLRTCRGHAVASRDLSDGTLLAVAILTLAHLPDPPSLIGYEEPDRGIHPRLLRRVRDALYRLAYPEGDREPVQVIATTHSPYLLDLFRDHPEEVVIVHKTADGFGTFERLSDRADLDEILGTAQLGDAWYAGVLGGVPAES